MTRVLGASPRVPCRCPQDRGWPSGNVWRHRRMRRLARGGRESLESVAGSCARSRGQGWWGWWGWVEDIFPSKSLEENSQKVVFWIMVKNPSPKNDLTIYELLGPFQNFEVVSSSGWMLRSTFHSGSLETRLAETRKPRGGETNFLPMQKRCCSRGRVVLQQSLWLNG